jgi:polyadenylate-binding protein
MRPDFETLLSNAVENRVRDAKEMPIIRPRRLQFEQVSVKQALLQNLNAGATWQLEFEGSNDEQQQQLQQLQYAQTYPNGTIVIGSNGQAYQYVNGTPTPVILSPQQQQQYAQMQYMQQQQQQQQMMQQQQQQMMQQQQKQMMQQQQRSAQAAQPDPNAPLSAAALAAAPPAMQKQMLGSKIYLQVQKFQPEMAGKITGMMLEMDNSELLILLESEVQLKNKVAEAMKVLEGMK